MNPKIGYLVRELFEDEDNFSFIKEENYYRRDYVGEYEVIRIVYFEVGNE